MGRKRWLHGARERERRGVRWEGWDISQWGLHFWSVCALRGEFQPFVAQRKQTGDGAIRGALDIMAM